jgi:hypothetical protein
MINQTPVLDVMPEPTGIEKITINCPACGTFQTIFGGWPDGALIKHKCEKCSADLVLQVSRQQKLDV